MIHANVCHPTITGVYHLSMMHARIHGVCCGGQSSLHRAPGFIVAVVVVATLDRADTPIRYVAGRRRRRAGQVTCWPYADMQLSVAPTAAATMPAKSPIDNTWSYLHIQDQWKLQVTALHVSSDSTNTLFGTCMLIKTWLLVISYLDACRPNSTHLMSFDF